MSNDPNLNKNVLIDPYNLPGNNKKLESKKPKKVEKVVSGDVKEKKSLGKKFSETFLAGDLNSVKEYLLLDVLIPTIKDTTLDILHGSLDVLFGGSYSSRRKKSSNGKTYVSYDNISRVPSSRREREHSRDERSRKKSGFDPEDYIFERKDDAERVFNNMIDILEEYERVTVTDFLDSIGKSTDYTLQNYGWTNLSEGEVRHIREGYIIDMPSPKLLER